MTKEERCLESIGSGRITIDADGRVWKHWRLVARVGKVHFEVPKRADYPDRLGYCRASIPVGGKAVIVYAHRLVWVATNGPIPGGKEINHIDGNKSNNRLSNLELVTKSENQQHSLNVTKTHFNLSNGGEKHPEAVLTWDKVDEMRLLRSQGWTYAKLGKRFGVSGVRARAICKKIGWRDKDRPAV